MSDRLQEIRARLDAATPGPSPEFVTVYCKCGCGEPMGERLDTLHGQNSRRTRAMASDRLTEIRARLDAATPGPWFHHPAEPWVYVPVPHGTFQKRILATSLAAGKYEDADLIAHAPADIAWLLEEVERLSQ